MRHPDRVTQAPLAGAATRGWAALNGALNQQATGLAARLLPFYRRHPYGGPLGLFTVDMRGAYSPEDGFFFNRVPKAANSTIMATLGDYSGYSKRFSRGGKKSRFLRPARMSAAEVARMDAEAFRFTFVRDPYGRALSAFADKVVRKRKQARPFFRWLGRVEAPAFIDFLRFLEDGGAMSDAHWAPQSDLMLLPVAEFHLVGRLERLEADLSAVVERVFAPAAPLAIRRAGPRTDSHRSLEGAYTPEAIGIVNRVYAADFETFGYPVRAS